MEIYTFGFFAFAVYIAVLFGIIASVGYLVGVVLVVIFISGSSEAMGNIIFILYNLGYLSFWYYLNLQDNKNEQKSKKSVLVPITKYVLAIVLSLPYIVAVSGVCIVEKKYFSDDEYIEKAIQSLANNVAVQNGYVAEDEHKSQDIKYKEIVHNIENKIKKFIEKYPKTVKVTHCQWCISQSEAPIIVRIAYFYNDKETQYINEYFNTTMEIPPKREVTGYLEVKEFTVCGKIFETSYGEGIQGPSEGHILQGSEVDAMFNPFYK